MTRDLLAGLVLTLAVATAAGAEVKTRVVDYKQGDTELQGMIAWDDAVTGTRPGVARCPRVVGPQRARAQRRTQARRGRLRRALRSTCTARASSPHTPTTP